MSVSKIHFIKYRKVFYIFSGLLTLLSILSIIFWGLKLSIDFTGGSLLEVKITSERNLTTQELGEELKTTLPDFKEIKIQPSEESYLIRTASLSETEHQQFVEALKQVATKDGKTGSVEEVRFESIGPVIGQELQGKTVIAVVLASIMIVVYVAWAFRKISRPVVSWKYGLGAVIALIHDLLILTGTFSVLGHFWGIEVDILFVTALLTILGYSVNDTIVVYDRTRENLIYAPEKTFEDTVNKSLNQTMGRSINTSVTVLLALFALYFLGGETIRVFVLALIIGVGFGTYSSIFVASSLLVDWYHWGKKR